MSQHKKKKVIYQKKYDDLLEKCDDLLKKYRYIYKIKINTRDTTKWCDIQVYRLP